MKGILALWFAGRFVRLAMRLNRARHVGFSWDGSELAVTTLDEFSEADYRRALLLQGKPVRPSENS